MCLTLTELDDFEILVMVFLNVQSQVSGRVGIFHQPRDLSVL